MNWKEFDKEIRKLGEKVTFKPDAVIGIVRGGVIPATVLANLLKVKKFYVIKMRHVGEEGRRVKGDFAPNVFEKKILLVEDMLETGKSLAAAKKYLEEKGAEVKTAALYTMPKSEIVPDFSLKKIPAVVPFPWE